MADDTKEYQGKQDGLLITAVVMTVIAGEFHPCVAVVWDGSGNADGHSDVCDYEGGESVHCCQELWKRRLFHPGCDGMSPSIVQVVLRKLVC